MFVAPLPDLHLLLNEVCHGAWDCRARRESHGPRPALASLESVVGLRLKHAPTPVLRFREKSNADTRPRAPHDSSLID